MVALFKVSDTDSVGANLDVFFHKISTRKIESFYELLL